MTTKKQAQRTPKPLTIDKDGSIRWDYYVRAETWEDGEFIITIGGAPVGQSLAAHDAKIIVGWLRTAAENLLNRDQLISDLYQASHRDATRVQRLENSLRNLLYACDGISGGVNSDGTMNRWTNAKAEARAILAESESAQRENLL